MAPDIIERLKASALSSALTALTDARSESIKRWQS